MKKINKRAMLISSVTAILASIATLPVSAAESNAYSISYETLTSAIMTDDGSMIPAGCVAVTMTINENKGFDATTVKLAVANECDVMVDSSGKPIVQKGNVLESAMASSAVSAEGDVICIVGAVGTTCTTTGELFTIYFYADEANSNEFITVTSCDMEEYSPQITINAVLPSIQSGNVCAPCQEIVDGDMIIGFYIIGDTTDDGIINVFDAVNIMTAHSRYAEIMNIPYETTEYDSLEIPVSYVRANPNTLFSDGVVYADSPDSDIDHSIGLDDADEVLAFSAAQSAGGVYSGHVGTMIVVEIRNF